MKDFLKTKAGVLTVCIVMFMMAFVLYRIDQKRRARHAAEVAAAAAVAQPEKPAAPAPAGAKPSSPSTSYATEDLARRAAYLDGYYNLGKQAHEGQDRQGNPVTRRDTAATPYDAGRVTVHEDPAAVGPTAPVLTPRISIRLQGRPAESLGSGAVAGTVGRLQQGVQHMLQPAGALESILKQASSPSPGQPGVGDSTASRVPAPRRPRRFNPYGNPVKCELVFTIDSTNENTPFVGLVVEPVYNNGQLVIPAGAEFHGTARPDRLRDRIFSGNDWVLVFPREGRLENGRQLNVKGVALDRIEPAANGMTWGITDGSYGLEGQVIHSQQTEEIERFVATALSAATLTLQDRQTNAFGQENVRSTSRNAVLAGISADMQQLASNISAEVEKHGVFIRVPAGHQFYFYPMQIIDPDAADISSDIATVK